MALYTSAKLIDASASALQKASPRVSGNSRAQLKFQCKYEMNMHAKQGDTSSSRKQRETETPSMPPSRAFVRSGMEGKIMQSRFSLKALVLRTVGGW